MDRNMMKRRQVWRGRGRKKQLSQKKIMNGAADENTEDGQGNGRMLAVLAIVRLTTGVMPPFKIFPPFYCPSQEHTTKSDPDITSFSS
jgi:hypothetical protein